MGGQAEVDLVREPDTGTVFSRDDSASAWFDVVHRRTPVSAGERLECQMQTSQEA